jgi:hypothetical protein
MAHTFDLFDRENSDPQSCWPRARDLTEAREDREDHDRDRDHEDREDHDRAEREVACRHAIPRVRVFLESRAETPVATMMRTI